VRSDIEKFMEHSYFIALESPDPSTQNGALVIGKDGDILGTGFNHFPPGTDLKYWVGPKEEKYARVVHAETAAIISVAQSRFSIVGGTLVCPWAACANCAKHIADSGIHKLIRHRIDPASHWYPDVLVGDNILLAANVEILEIPIVQTTLRLRRNGNPWPEILTPEEAQVALREG
jgi:deoxycytidylate deaminase